MVNCSGHTLLLLDELYQLIRVHNQEKKSHIFQALMAWSDRVYKNKLMTVCYVFSADFHSRCKWLGNLSSLLLYLFYIDYSLNQWLLNTYCAMSNENNAKKVVIIPFTTRIYHLSRSLENSARSLNSFLLHWFFTAIGQENYYCLYFPLIKKKPLKVLVLNQLVDRNYRNKSYILSLFCLSNMCR